MAITFTTRGSGADQTDGTSFAYTPATTPSSDKLLLLTYVLLRVGSTAETPSGVSGLGLTWTHITGVTFSTNRRVGVYRAVGTVTPGSLTLTTSNTHHSCIMHITEVDGVDAGGTNGSNAIVQSATNTGASVTGLTVTLAAFADAANGGFGAFGSARNETPSPGTGWTGYGALSNADIGFRAIGRPDNDTTCDITGYTANTNIGGVAIELKAASAGGGPAARLTGSIILASPLFGGIYLR